MSVIVAMVVMLAQTSSPLMNMEQEGMDRRQRVPAAADQETDPAKYRAKAKALYLQAQSLLGRDLGMESAQAFRLVIEKYPFSRYAVMAEFGHAKSLAAQGESEGALAGFTRFLKQHPGHPKTKDVRHAIVTTSWAEKPSDFFMLPPPYERDLEDARATVIAANAFLHFHADDQRGAAVRRIKRSARALLYRQAVFLARWTADQGRAHAALARWKMVREEFSEQAIAPKDKIWLKNLTALAAKTSLEHPKEPELHPQVSVTGESGR